jgi:hypothetical protein
MMPTTMTRHERCRAAIAGQSVDRMPTYLPAISCQVASALLGRKAYAGTGSLHYAEVLAWSRGKQAHDEFEAQFFEDLGELHRVLDIDVLRMPWRFNRRPARQLDEFTFLFGDCGGAHEIWAYQPSSGDFGLVRNVGAYDSPEQWLEAALRESEARAADPDQTQDAARQSHARLQQRFGAEFFVISIYGGISAGIDEQELMALALEPEICARRMIAQANSAIAWGRWLAQSGAPAVMLGGGDLASSTGPIYSPDTFRKVLLPAYAKVAAELGPLGVHYGFRSDGNLGAVADMLFGEAGIAGYGEVDRDAGMTVGKLRRAYPHLVLWGQFSSAMLAEAKPAAIKDECHRILDENGPSRYFHACSNAIVQGTPVENVLAMYAVR